MRTGSYLSASVALVFAIAVNALAAQGSGAWSGGLWDGANQPVGNARVRLHPVGKGQEYAATTSASGRFSFAEIGAGNYRVSVESSRQIWTLADPVVVEDGAKLSLSLQLLSGQQLHAMPSSPEGAAQASGGEHLSSGKVSSLPLNARDFSKLLLLAAGTMTDANGAANFTQQFAVNGQRGVTSVFAIDGFDTTDPEMGGATFSNFNVDAIQEVQGSSGVIPAEIGHGAASYTNVVTKSGVNQVHGSMFV